MGGVDKSDQYISYNRIQRKTVRYWKTFLYHLLEICATNSSILYNWRRMELQQKSVSQAGFRDKLVQQVTPFDPGKFAVVHGSQFREDTTKKRCLVSGTESIVYGNSIISGCYCGFQIFVPLRHLDKQNGVKFMYGCTE